MVDKNTKISELFKTDKNAVNVFKKFDLACPGCRGQAQDTIANFDVKIVVYGKIVIDGL